MTTTPLPPNKEGATQCIVRWQVETAAGWLGAYNKDAFEAYATQARADLEAENQRLREALEFVARHKSSDWPERCQQMVNVARNALKDQP